MHAIPTIQKTNRLNYSKLMVENLLPYMHIPGQTLARTHSKEITHIYSPRIINVPFTRYSMNNNHHNI
jgi:hypothetical protein